MYIALVPTIVYGHVMYCYKYAATTKPWWRWVSAAGASMLGSISSAFLTSTQQCVAWPQLESVYVNFYGASDNLTTEIKYRTDALEILHRSM